MKHVTICGTDLSRFSIVLNKDPAPAERTAADFLRRVFSVSAGIEVPVVCESAPHGICLGSRPAADSVKWDGFRITAREGSLFLDGNIPRGTLYAAFSLAERFLGYRYFSDDTEVIPTEGEAAIPADLDIVDNPGFEGRRTTICAAVRSPQLSAHLRLNDCMP
ncbi:MAG: hypothetical protein II719_00690, partial [Clostridia bacterium]|nr:hypothetical protein [Clostridia bacterium]